MKLKVTNWAGLCEVISSIPNAKIKNTAGVRQSVGLTDQIRKAIKPFYDEVDVINKKVIEARKPFEDKAIGASEEELKNINKELAEKLKPFNIQRRELNDKYASEEKEIKLDQNYKNFVKEYWEEHIRKCFVDKDDAVVIADAFEIQ